MIKGLEPIKGSYPIWARQNLVTLTEFILERGKRLNIEDDIIPKLQALKDEAKTLTIDDLSFNYNIRVYEKYVTSEARLEIKKGISIYPRASVYYNHLLIFHLDYNLSLLYQE